MLGARTIARRVAAFRCGGGRGAVPCMVLFAGRSGLARAVRVRRIRHQEAEGTLPPPEESGEHGQALHAAVPGTSSWQVNDASTSRPANLMRWRGLTPHTQGTTANRRK